MVHKMAIEIEEAPLIFLDEALMSNDLKRFNSAKIGVYPTTAPSFSNPARGGGRLAPCRAA
jgi:hypothetical protein